LLLLAALGCVASATGCTYLGDRGSDALDIFDVGILVSDHWRPEGAAMAQANIPAVLDVMNLMASVHNKSASDALRKRVEELEKRLQDLDPEGAEKIRPDLPVPPSICYGPIRRRRAQRRLRFETTLTRVSSGTSEIFGRSSRLCQGPCLGSH
jgi:hypothetical protein